MGSMTLDEIFKRLFTRERYTLNHHIPYYVQHFAPPSVQRAVHDELSRALLEKAALSPYKRSKKASSSFEHSATDAPSAHDADASTSSCASSNLSDNKSYSEDSSLVTSASHDPMDQNEEELEHSQNKNLDSAHEEELYIDGCKKESCHHYVSAEFEAIRSEIRYALEEDRVHVAMSSPFRRLQQKTQVFPLDVNATARSRLTHTLEVGAYTRLAVYALGERIPKLKPIINEMMLCLETASYVHDLGNPPFGHFGELIIRNWVKDATKEHASKLCQEEIDDLKAFNGNAQGLRQAHTIQRFNLTFGQIGSFIKVPRTYSELRALGFDPDKAEANTGFFLSESKLVERLRKSNFARTRHPLSLIMEECDDLAYVLADLEDAYDRKVLKDFEIINLIDNLINFLKENACYTTCEFCTSSCTCAHGDRHEFRGMTEELEAGIKFKAPKPVEDFCCSNKHKDEEESHTQAQADASNDSADEQESALSAPQVRSEYHAPDDDLDTLSTQERVSRVTGVMPGGGSISNPKHNDKAKDASLSADNHDATAAQDEQAVKDSAQSSSNTVIRDPNAALKLPRNLCQSAQGTKRIDNNSIQLDIVLSDMIKHEYCRLKDDTFEVLQSVHGANPLSLTTMMEEIGVRSMLMLLREVLSTYYVLDIVNNIAEHEEDFFKKGSLNITFFGNDAHKAVEYIRKYEKEHIYRADVVESLELQGAAYIKCILNTYLAVLSISADDFYKCVTEEKGDLYICHLVKRISRRYKEAYLYALKHGKQSEMYLRIRMIIDYVAGMTDTYAANESSILVGFRH